MTITNRQSGTNVHEVADGIYRINTPIVIDARMKPWYPKEVSCRPEVADTVSRRWREYFPNGGVEMGDSEAGHLD